MAPGNYGLYQLGEVAERWYELGEKEEARTLFADGLRLANEIQDKTSSSRGSFAARLARVDPPSALAIARKFPAGLPYSVGWVLRNLAFRLAADDPAEAERVLRQIRPKRDETGCLAPSPGKWPRWIRLVPAGWWKNRNGIGNIRRSICSLPLVSNCATRRPWRGI